MHWSTEPARGDDVITRVQSVIAARTSVLGGHVRHAHRLLGSEAVHAGAVSGPRLRQFGEGGVLVGRGHRAQTAPGVRDHHGRGVRVQQVPAGVDQTVEEPHGSNSAA
ncbi:hypothetical protein ACH470_27015 [Streptomyces bottropensis]|uniref:hypothetical protein n=1 Tax=Streptomyces bottropensis TaxID=42235 RepID=UPI0037B3BE08